MVKVYKYAPGKESAAMDEIALLAKLRNLTDAVSDKSPVPITVMPFDDRST